MTQKSGTFIKVAVPVPVRNLYTYSVPGELNGLISIGKRVTVPFKNRKITGYIMEIEEPFEGVPSEIKPVQDIIDPVPLFHEGLVPFFKWMSSYYLFPIGMLIKSVLPGGFNKKNSKGAGPLKRKFVRVREDKDVNSILMDRNKKLRAVNEEDFLAGFAGPEAYSLKELISKYSNGAYLVKKWIDAGLLMSYERDIFRDPSGKPLDSKPEPASLYDQQQNVLNKICGLLEKGGFSACLLNGVTGSGKTEVYYRAVKRVIEMGKQAILLMPEIALAQYTEGFFKTRLGQRVAVFHSGMSMGEQYDQWMLMAKGGADLVIGARSALFAPMERLGLIIVDEEYDSSYKQEESPRYQARDSAVARARIEKALVVLGAGTPSVPSYHNALNGRYHLLSMPERIEKRPLPDIELVDMKSFSGRSVKEQILSPLLRKAVETSLSEQRQVMLFLNRRGFSNVYICRSCGESVKCPNCDLTLTYHLQENSLFCHYCGYDIRPEKNCIQCGHKGMRAFGFGTERLEQEIGEIFPQARIGRLDRDSTRRKGETYRILKSFSRNETDILVGTQMLAKGYDFPNVTLVGVICADITLGFPDFRAGERTFQLLSQVGGRAGRGIHRGRVIVQTFNPDHYAIVAAKNHDYDSFFKKEKEMREELRYPPFSFLACIRFQGNSKSETEKTSSDMGDLAGSILAGWPKRGKEIRIMGPVPAPLARLRGKYRWQMLIKSKGTELLHFFLNRFEDLARGSLRKSGVSMTIDIDPYQML